jgi:hypothetical protein
MDKLKIYLAGGQQYSKDKGVGWREQITPRLYELGFSVFDPTKHEDFVKERYGSDWEELTKTDLVTRFKLGGELIDFDYEVLRQSAAMLVYWDESAVRGGGTKSEITWSKQLGIPCYVVLAEGFTIQDLPLWTCGGIRSVDRVVCDFEMFLFKLKEDFSWYCNYDNISPLVSYSKSRGIVS